MLAYKNIFERKEEHWKGRIQQPFKFAWKAAERFPKGER